MTYQDAAIAYSKGLICFEELIAMRGEFDDQETPAEECDHTGDKEIRNCQLWCADCGELIDGGPDGDGRDD